MLVYKMLPKGKINIEFCLLNPVGPLTSLPFQQNVLFLWKTLPSSMLSG